MFVDNYILQSRIIFLKVTNILGQEVQTNIFVWTMIAEQAVEHSNADQKIVSSILGRRCHKKMAEKKHCKIITSIDIDIKLFRKTAT